MIAALLAAMTGTALAEEMEFDLPIDGDSMEQGGAMPQWLTSGTDQKEVPLTWDILKASTGIVFEMPEDPGWWVGIIFGEFQPDSGWNWDAGQRDAITYFYNGGKLLIWWEQNGYDFSDLTEDDSGVKMLFGQWGVSWSEHGVTRVYLMDLDPIELREPIEPEPPAPEPIEIEPPAPEPIEPEPPAPEPPVEDIEPIAGDIEKIVDKKKGGMPIWGWILIGLGAVAAVVVIIIAVNKNKGSGTTEPPPPPPADDPPKEPKDEEANEEANEEEKE